MEGTLRESHGPPTLAEALLKTNRWYRSTWRATTEMMFLSRCQDPRLPSSPGDLVHPKQMNESLLFTMGKALLVHPHFLNVESIAYSLTLAFIYSC